jgi:hypothetical protein
MVALSDVLRNAAAIVDAIGDSESEFIYEYKLKVKRLFR